MAWYIDPIAQCIGAEQAGMRIIAENIYQSAGIDWIDMLRVKRQSVTCQPVGNPRISRSQPPDGGEQP